MPQVVIEPDKDKNEKFFSSAELLWSILSLVNGFIKPMYNCITFVNHGAVNLLWAVVLLEHFYNELFFEYISWIDILRQV